MLYIHFTDERFFTTNVAGVRPKYVISDAVAYFHVCLLQEPVYKAMQSVLASNKNIQMNFQNKFLKTFTVNQGLQECFIDISTKDEFQSCYICFHQHTGKKKMEVHWARTRDLLLQDSIKQTLYLLSYTPSGVENPFFFPL